VVTNNGHIVRKVVAIALSLAVQVAALSAPLVHAHPDDHATEHHGAGEVHTHWAGHDHPRDSSHSPALDAVDRDRAVFLNAFVAVAASLFPSQAVTLAVFTLPAPRERAPHRVIDIANGHDPPCRRSLSSRAPPSLLS
jgi:hypothetical protein